ncbi:hypothetical protein PV04_00086 [Phialophora macrospora]|uniref:CFEM domain-containing protein n=1 Tax=Phialophora macrospora TaxID=1851006 RepID=A0A0D2FZE3_9EURO|nr:hypothetical protein PV04_00086 [Phialophora macrospora]
MVSPPSMIRAILVLLCIKWSAAHYEKWEDLPNCAQDCLAQAVNASLAGCTELSLDCFCQNGFATVAFDLCLASDSSCDSDSVKADAESFQGNIFCNPDSDSGFRFTAVKGIETVTLGLSADSDEGTTNANTDQEQTTTTSSPPSSSSLPATVAASATSTTSTSAPVATRTTPGIITSVSTVVVEMSSITSTSRTVTSTSTGPSVTTIVVIAAASSDFMRILDFASNLIMIWVLASVPDICGWP